jgi:hypothetical protein
VPAKQMLALDTNTNAIAATAGLFINVDNKDVLNCFMSFQQKRSRNAEADPIEKSFKINNR